MIPRSARWTIALGSAILGLMILLVLRDRCEEGLRLPGIRGPGVGCKITGNRAVCLQQLPDTCLGYRHVITFQPCDSTRDETSDVFGFVQRYIDTVQSGRPVAVVELRCVDGMDIRSDLGVQKRRIRHPFLTVYVDPRTETWRHPVYSRIITWINDSVELDFPIGQFPFGEQQSDADTSADHVSPP